MPGKRCVFTTRVEPVSPPQMVEAPGTAPGSTTIIPHTVYRHSQQADDGYLCCSVRRFKPGWQESFPGLNDRRFRRPDVLASAADQACSGLPSRRPEWASRRPNRALKSEILFFAGLHGPRSHQRTGAALGGRVTQTFAGFRSGSVPTEAVPQRTRPSRAGWFIISSQRVLDVVT
jgi:hypothetical protein